MTKKYLQIFLLTLTIIILLSTITTISATNNTSNEIKKENNHKQTEIKKTKIIKDDNKILKKNKSNTIKKDNDMDVNITINSIKSVDYLNPVTITGQIATPSKTLNKDNIQLYINNTLLSNNNLTINTSTGNFTYKTTLPKGNYTFQLTFNDAQKTYNSSITNFAVTEKIFPLLDKNRPIYFAMDHTSNKDNIISSLIVDELISNGFNVVRSKIGPNTMYENIVYMYNNKVTNAIIFNLFNGVDPSSIRELAVNGNDNRGRIVRSRGNDVVLAWFYDSADPVHENGSCYLSVRASESGLRLNYPKRYMDENDIYSICTSSDCGRHGNDADYTGYNTVQEFMKLFKNDTKTKSSTIITSDILSINYGLVEVGGTVESADKIVSGNVLITNDDGEVLVADVEVKDGEYNATIKFKQSGEYLLTVYFIENDLFLESSTILYIRVTVKSMELVVDQVGSMVGKINITAKVVNYTTDEFIPFYDVIFETEDGTKNIIQTDENGYAIFNYDFTHNQTVTVSILDSEDQIYDIIKYDVNFRKTNVNITVNPVVGMIGDDIQLTAMIEDEYLQKVSGGNLVFKLNGKTLREDNRFDSDASAKKFSVKNGIVNYIIKADLYLRNAKNITASYSGTTFYAENKSDTVTAQIKKRYAKIELEVTPNHVNQYENITILVKVRDNTSKEVDNKLINNNSYVMIKINNKTLLDSNGKVKMFFLDENNTLNISYYIAPGTGGINNNKLQRNYMVTVIFVSDNYYPDSRNTTNYSVERLDTYIDITKIEIRKQYMNLTANIKDSKMNYVIGTNKILIKINGKSYVNSSTQKAVYYEVQDGIVNLTNIKLPQNTTVKRVLIVSGERQAYYENRAESFEINYIE